MVAQFDQVDDIESEAERASGQPLLEIYNPVLQPWSGEVVAVSEFYEIATDFSHNLRQALIWSWLAVGLATLGFFLVLSAIVFRGSRTIDNQSRALKDRVSELSVLLLRTGLCACAFNAPRNVRPRSTNAISGASAPTCMMAQHSWWRSRHSSWTAARSPTQPRRRKTRTRDPCHQIEPRRCHARDQEHSALVLFCRISKPPSCRKSSRSPPARTSSARVPLSLCRCPTRQRRCRPRKRSASIASCRRH